MTMRFVPVLFTLLLSLLCAPPSNAQKAVIKITLPAPYFILPTVDGNTLRSTSLKGQVMLLDFFQTWCPDCQKSSVGLEKLYQKYKDQGFVVLGISHDKEKEQVVKPYVKKYGLTFPVLLGDQSIAVNYVGISREKPSFNIPFLVLVDRKGNIVARYEEGRHPQASNLELLEAEIKKLL